jgi:hypothetical protein
MMYEVLISTTIAMVLLPFNFWFAVELVLLVGLFTTLWELREMFFAIMSFRNPSVQRADN